MANGYVDDGNKDEQKAYAEIMGDMAYAVASSIPPLSMVLAVSEVVKAAWDLLNSKSRAEISQAKFQLLMGIICVIPGIGGGFRLAFKSLIKKPQFYGPVMFDVVVAILEEANRLFKMNLPLNPEKYLTQMINVPVLQKYLDEIRRKSVAELNEVAFIRWTGAPDKLDSALRDISDQLTIIIEDILAPAVRIAIERCLMRRKNSAKTSHIIANNKKSSPAKNKKSSSTKDNKGSRPTVTKSRGNLTARIKSLYHSINMNFVIGGVGEHIADYYCLETLCWGIGQWDGHDKAKHGTWKLQPNEVNLGKLNNDKKLTKNSPIGNATGIDGLWRAQSAMAINDFKKYAVVEVKATTSIASSSDAYIARQLGVLSKTYQNKPIIQMDRYWIKERLNAQLPRLPKGVQTEFNFKAIDMHGDFSSLYSRHIIVVSLLVEPGLSHIEALLNTQSKLPHASHSGTLIHVSGEQSIEKIISVKHDQLKNKNKNKKQTKKQTKKRTNKKKGK